MDGGKRGGETIGSRDPGEPMAGKKRVSGFGGKRESRNHLSRFSAGHESPSGKTIHKPLSLSHTYTHTNSNRGEATLGLRP